MLMIRFQRIGRRNDPAFRIVAIEKARSPQSGNPLELLGTYNPRSKALTLKEERVKEWVSKGAQVSPSLKNLLINKGILTGKKVNVLPRKTKIIKEVPVAEIPKAKEKKEEKKEEKEAVLEETTAEPVVSEKAEEAAPQA